MVIFDDYLDALVRLNDHYRGRNVRLVHMKTMKMGRKASVRGCHGWRVTRTSRP